MRERGRKRERGREREKERGKERERGNEREGGRERCQRQSATRVSPVGQAEEAGEWNDRELERQRASVAGGLVSEGGRERKGERKKGRERERERGREGERESER